jgi:hypothetical protein
MKFASALFLLLRNLRNHIDFMMNIPTEYGNFLTLDRLIIQSSMNYIWTLVINCFLFLFFAGSKYNYCYSY